MIAGVLSEEGIAGSSPAGATKANKDEKVFRLTFAFYR